MSRLRENPLGEQFHRYLRNIRSMFFDLLNRFKALYHRKLTFLTHRSTSQQYFEHNFVKKKSWQFTPSLLPLHLNAALPTEQKMDIVKKLHCFLWKIHECSTIEERFIKTTYVHFAKCWENTFKCFTNKRWEGNPWYSRSLIIVIRAFKID